MKPFILLTILLSSTLSLFITSARAQGPLTPPGSPAPTMKTLAQIEPRTPITSLPFAISASGSYYLTANLTGVSGSSGITITGSNVTLDLGGFTLSGAAGSTHGIGISGNVTNVAIRDGNLNSWPGNSVSVVEIGTRNVVLERLNALGSGATAFLLYNTLITDCSVAGGSVGIVSYGGRIRNCSLSGCGTGIILNGGVVTGSLVRNCTQSGILASAPGNQITGNTCTGNNTSSTANHAGIYVNHTGTLVEGNNVSGTGQGGIQISSLYTGNILIRNIVFGNGANNYLGLTGNDAGPVSTAAAATSPWANISR